MRDPGERVDEGHGLVIVREVVGLVDLAAVERPALQAFAGSLEGQRASKGVFLTTSYFTGEAEEYVRRISRRIVLVDGRALTRLMYDYGIGVRSGRSLVVKRVDDAYFEGEV